MLTFQYADTVHNLPVTPRCLFCLSKFDDESYDPLSSFVNDIPVQEFRTVWKHLFMEEEEDDDYRFPATPSLCSTCGSNLRQIYSALVQLTKATSAIRNGVKTCGKIVEFVEELKEATIENETFIETINLLKKIGYGPGQGGGNLPKKTSSSDNEEERIEIKIESESDSESFVLPDDDNVEDFEETCTEQKKSNMVVIVRKHPEPSVPSSSSTYATEPRRLFTRAVLPPPTNRDPPTVRVVMKLCDFCGERVHYTNILKHVQSHVGEFAIPCPNRKCKCVFSNPSSLRRHCCKVRGCGKHLKKDTNECQICGHRCASISGLARHFQETHETDDKPYFCPVTDCNERFTFKQSVSCHITAHTVPVVDASRPTPSSHNCQFCGKSFKKNKLLFLHEKSHNAPKPKVFSCDLPGCGKMFYSRKALKSHTEDPNHDDGAFRCLECGKEFNFEKNLKVHMRDKHSERERLVCDECGESFRDSQVLRVHKRIHTGERPYQCDICAQRFRTQGVFRTHRKGHEQKGAAFKPNGPMTHVRKRVNSK